MHYRNSRTLIRNHRVVSQQQLSFHFCSW